jgi:hypothetical protein
MIAAVLSNKRKAAARKKNKRKPYRKHHRSR